VEAGLIEEPWHVAVLIPARNEEEHLPRCLQSVLQAVARVEYSITTDIVVVVDSSTDRTQTIATELLRGNGVVLTTNAGMVGEARRRGASAALARYRGPLHRFWFANTDADSMVPPNWLTEQLRLAGEGVEGIAGSVDVDHFDEHQEIVAHRFRTTYLVAPDGTHSHVHGANLGVRGDAYVRAGGWGSLSTGEDHDLWRRLRVTSAVLRSTTRTKLVTSGRRVGRAPGGFADALAAHNETAV
jgi:glycosyltransferase involved in cell wall biosynthesis